MEPGMKRLIGFLLIILSAFFNVLVSNNRSLNKTRSFITSLVTAVTGFYILII